MPRLTSEIGLAAGYSGYLGSGIAYTASYTKEVTIEEGIRNYQYLDRLTSLYQDRGVELHRRQPGFLTGTNIPPCVAIAIAVLDALLAAEQGVRNYGLELGQTLHLVQDAASLHVCRELAQEYLVRLGHQDVFTPSISLHWMGAWPQDEAQAATLISYGGTLAAVGGAVSCTTKSTHEAIGIPTPEANAEGLRMTRMAIYLARNIRLNGLEEYEREADLIRREVRPVVDKGTGDGRRRRRRRHGTRIRGGCARCPVVAEPAGCEPGASGARRRRIPAHVRSGQHARFPGDVLRFHEERLRKRAERERRPYDHELAVTSVYEMSQPIGDLLPCVGSAH